MPSKEDLNLCTKYFTDLANDAALCTKFVENITARIENGNLDFSDGNSFLDLRNQFLLDYLINLTKLVQLKSNGEKLEENPIIDRLIQLRVYIEKGQTIYNKLSYQIEKTLSLGKTTSLRQDNPLKFRPRPENLIDDEEQFEDSEQEDDEEEQPKYRTNERKKSGPKSDVYVPPKVAAMMYDDDDTLENTKRKSLEKAKKRAISSSIIEELKKEYDEGPEEISLGSARKRTINKKLNAIREFEEENFTRINLSKKEKQQMKKSMMTTSTLSDDITSFGDTSFLTRGDDDMPTSSRSRKKPKYKSTKGKKSIKRRKLR